MYQYQRNRCSPSILFAIDMKILYPGEVANEFTSLSTCIADLKKGTKHPRKIFVMLFPKLSAKALLALASSKSISISL